LRIGLLCILTLLPLVGGCRLFGAMFLLFAPEPTRTEEAKYPYLTDKKVCIVIWTDSYTAMEYPFVRLELSEHIVDAIKANVHGVSFIPNRSVIKLQDKDAAWDRTHPAQLGKRFGADRVLMIDVTQYTMREPESTYLYRGRNAANVRVYNPDYPDAAPVHEATVETVYPPDSHGAWGSEEKSIRKLTMEAFAQEIAAQFYDRQVKVE